MSIICLLLLLLPHVNQYNNSTSQWKSINNGGGYRSFILQVPLCDHPSRLSWSPHIDSIHSKSKKLLGLLYRHFYHHSTPSVLFKLYLSLVLTVLVKDVLQFFALKLCGKYWSADYATLLHEFKLPSLSTRRSISKLLLLYKLIYALSFQSCFFF